MASHPSQPPKAHVHILKLALAKLSRVSKISSQPSQPLKATIHILESEKTSLSKNSERFKNGKSTKSTTKSADTYSALSFRENGN